jgi:radical SAM protein with 4Fe4S-binding SPASM domain
MRIKKGIKKPDVSIWFLALRSNLGELLDILSLTGKLGVKNFYLQTSHSWGNPLWKEKVAEEQVNNNFVQIKQVFSRAANLAKKRQIRFEYVNVPDKSKSRVCQWPWRSCYITVDGYITPCCLQGADPKIVNFGNVFKEDFEDIWNNVKYQNFRKKLKSNIIPSICLDCPSYYSKVKI